MPYSIRKYVSFGLSVMIASLALAACKSCGESCIPEGIDTCGTGLTCQKTGGGYVCAGGPSCLEPPDLCHALCTPGQPSDCPGLTCAYNSNAGAYWCQGSPGGTVNTTDCSNAPFKQGIDCHQSCIKPNVNDTNDPCSTGTNCQLSNDGFWCANTTDCPGVLAPQAHGCHDSCDPAQANSCGLNMTCLKHDNAGGYWCDRLLTDNGDQIDCSGLHAKSLCGVPCDPNSSAAQCGAGTLCVKNAGSASIGTCQGQICDVVLPNPQQLQPVPMVTVTPTKAPPKPSQPPPPVSKPTPTVAPLTPTVAPALEGADGSLCGDGICQAGESADWCGDCASGGGTTGGGKGGKAKCGDGKCNGSEDARSCPKDCHR